MRAQVTGLILAGGLGSRMGSINKGLVTLAGKPMVQHVIDTLSPQVDNLIVSANDDIREYESFGYKVVSDDAVGNHAGQLGPLAGILSAKSHISSELIFITACDMPLLPNDIIDAMTQTPFSQNELARAPLLNDKIEPLACLVRRSALDVIGDQLDKGQRSVLRWLERCMVTHIALPTDIEAAFLNINTLADLNQADSGD